MHGWQVCEEILTYWTIWLDKKGRREDIAKAPFTKGDADQAEQTQCLPSYISAGID